MGYKKDKIKRHDILLRDCIQTARKVAVVAVVPPIQLNLGTTATMVCHAPMPLKQSGVAPLAKVGGGKHAKEYAAVIVIVAKGQSFFNKYLRSS